MLAYFKVLATVVLMSLWGSAVTYKIANTVCWQWWLQYGYVADIFFFLHCPFLSRLMMRFFKQIQSIPKVYWNMNIRHHELSICQGKVVWKRFHFCENSGCTNSIQYFAVCFICRMCVWKTFQKLTNVLDAVDKIVCRETVKHANSFISWNYAVYLHQSLVKTNLISLSHHFELQTGL